MFERTPLIDEKHILRARELSVSLLLDGAKAAGIEGCGCMHPGIQAAFSERTMVGTALTVETEVGDNYPIHLAIYGAKQPGYVLVIDGKNHEGCAYMGDLMMGACQALGFSGVVIDGYIRDRNGCAALELPIYCRGFMPRAPLKKRGDKINQSILCGGAQVCPGDLVMGDDDGVCVIPRAHIEAVLDGAEKRRDYEAAREAAIAGYNRAKAAGGPLPDITPQWVQDVLFGQGAK